MTKARILIPAVLCACANAMANSGAQLPFSQFQAGTETTTGNVVNNSGFEQPGTIGANPTGWTAHTNGTGTPAVTTSAPPAAHLPNNPAALGNVVVKAGINDVTFIDDYRQIIQLQPNTDYVLSTYMWAYGVPGFPGDLAVINLRDTVDPTKVFGLVLEPTASDGGSGGNGYFVYKPFNSGFFANGQVQLEVQTDPNEDLAGTRPDVMAYFDNVAVTPLNGFAVHKWTGASGGNWGDNANWLNGAPNNQTTVASFLSRGAATTINVESNKTVDVLTIDSANPYTFSGPGEIRLQHDENREAVYLNSISGSHTIDTPVVVVQPSDITFHPYRNLKVNVGGAGDTLTVTKPIGRSGSQLFDLEKNGAGRVMLNRLETRMLRINAGRVSFATGAATSVTREFAIAAGASLDIGTGAFIVDHGDNDTLTGLALTNALRDGRITSRALDGRTVVGIIPITTAGTFAGTNVDATAFGLRYTRAGDSDLNLTVNFDDLLILARNYGQQGRSYWQGDSDYSGTVDFNDLLALARNYGSSLPTAGQLAQLGAGVAGDWALAQSLVPEPTTLSIAGCAAILGLARRRSR